MYACLYAMLGVAICFNLIFVVQSKTNPQTLPKLFDKKFLTVQTNEAKDIALSGDFVVLDCVTSNELSVGDAVAAKTSRGMILGIVENCVLYNGENSFVIETSNYEGNSFTRIINAKNIEGRVERKISVLGNMATIVQRYFFILVISEVLLLCIALYDMFGVAKPDSNFLCF